MASTGEEKLDLKDPLRTFINFINDIARWQMNQLPSTQKEEAEKKLNELVKDASKAYCSDCDEQLILNVKISRAGRRSEMFGTSYCPKCKVSNRYRRFM